MTYSSNKWREILAVGMAVIVIGSIWGLAEMALGGLLHAIHFPQKGAIMGGLAISLMAIFFTITKKPLLIPLLGAIAASFKPFSAIIFGMPVLSPFVVNPATAIIMEALSFTTVMVALRRAINHHILARVGAGFLAGFLGYAFYGALASIIGQGNWPTLDLMAKLKLIMTSATPIGIAGAIMLFAGYYLGTASAPRLSSLRELHPRLYYSASLALMLLCWATVAVL
jgi:hypothetical protein